MKHKYETLLLLSPELSAESRQEIMTSLQAVIERDGGQIIEVDEWGMRELAYPVQKMSRGYYIRLEYIHSPEFVAELERNIRIMDGIFKFMTEKLAEKVEN